MMDPNPWNYNQTYSRIGTLPAGHGGINRIDFPLEQATLSSGLGLAPSLPPHANLTSRSLGGIPGVNYPGHHPLHTSMSQFLDPMPQLSASFSPQPTYKPVPMPQSPFPFETLGRSSSEIPATYSPSRYSASAQGLSVHSKPPLFSPSELTSTKELSSSYSTAVAQNSLNETPPKGWGLTNFLPPPSAPFGNLSDPIQSEYSSVGLSQAQQTPPPAHSSGSRISTIQRNPYSADSLFTESPRPVKPLQSLHSPRDPLPFTNSSSSYGRVSDSIQSPKPSLPPPTPQSYTASPPAIEDLSSHSQSHPIYGSYISSAYNSIPASNPIYSSSQLARDMDYDPVSPATPLSEPPQANNDNPFTTVSLQDLAALGTSTAVQEKHIQREPSREPSNVLMPQESMLRSSLEKSNRLSKESAHVQSLPSHMTMQHTPPGIHNGGQSVASPMQQSPISVGSPQVSSMSVASPQISMPLGSPQSLLPSSTVGPAPPPVQAMADSTTKPKRGRGSRGGRGGGPGRPRKRKEDESTFLGELHQPPMFSNDIAQQQSQPQQQPAYNDMSRTTQGYRPDSRPEMNQTYMHSDMSPLPPPRQMSAGQTPDAMQRSPLQENLVGVQHQQHQHTVKDQMASHRIHPMSDELHSHHSSMSSLNSGHQPSPMQEAMSLNHQAAYCDNMVSGQHPSPLTNPSPPNHIPMDGSHMARNTDSSSMNSHSALSDSSMDQRGSVLSAVRETEAIINGFVDTPFMDQLADTPPPGSGPMDYQAQGPVMVDMNNHNSFQDAINNGMHLSQYGNSFPMPQEEPHITDLDMVDNTGSTIDEVTFSSLFGSPFLDKGRRKTKAEQKVMPIVTVTPSVDEDDELCHLAMPPSSVHDNSSYSKEEERKRKLFGSSFQDSYLSYLMGKKQETLESLSSATVYQKPQLPKYIPEPRRPRPNTPPRGDMRPFCGSSDEGSSYGGGFSDSDSNDSVTKSVQNVITHVGEEDFQDRPGKYKDLTIKISKSRIRSGKTSRGRGPRWRHKGKGVAELPEGADPTAVIPQVEEEDIIQPRERISRKAKEKTLEKKKTNPDSSNSSSSDDENIKSITMEDSERDYDSDKDPAWTPFDVDIRQPNYDAALADRPKRLRKISAKGRSPRSRNRVARRRSAELSPEISPDSHLKVAKYSPVDEEEDDMRAVIDDPNHPGYEQEHFGIGKFILEKKDMHNYESYPIWKIEQGRMIHKYEILTEDGLIRHRAVSTYSSWMPTMKDQFVPIRVSLVAHRDLTEVVEVREEYRPKPPTDGSLENKYEDDPLVDLFNVYLQIFLSQALEPGFLSAITEAQDHFYLSALERIDKLIARKLEEIDRKIMWKPSFKLSLKLKPQLREIDRPNLKQSCQACENSSPPTIKTVHFLGTPYDRFDLYDLQDDRELCTEFMIGKTAAMYVGMYHSLHHFKYHLYKRCIAKVKLLKDSSKGISNEKLLDDCLHNRAWVLKIFEDLKRMLEKG